MKNIISNFLLAAASVTAVVLPPQQALGRGDALVDNEQFLLETAPGVTRWVAEDEKWALKRVSHVFDYHTCSKT